MEYRNMVQQHLKKNYQLHRYTIGKNTAKRFRGRLYLTHLVEPEYRRTKRTQTCVVKEPEQNPNLVSCSNCAKSN